MRSANERRGRLRRVGGWAAGMLVLLGAVGAVSGQRGQTVYYQVTYADGTMRDVSAVPTTGRNITRVLRVLRVETGDKGAEILSTGPQVLTYVNRGQTYRSDLRWNGTAWVAPEDVGPARPLGPAAQGPKPAPASGPAASEANVLRAQAELVAVSRKLLAAHEKLTAVERSLKAPPAGRSDRPSVAAEVAAAREAVRAALMAVIETARKLSPAPPASGKVTPATTRPAQDAAGIARPIDDVAALPYRTQVWKLPAAAGERTCHVSIAHPEAGAFGEFYYVAYADTTGDGRPDKFLARSPPARADRPGAWTRWHFTTSQRDVFVGKAWLRPATSHYHSTAVVVNDRWRGLSQEAYVSADLWGLPRRRVGPCLGNVRVWVGDGRRE